jgi:GNAT superfamily N-acetyltransferase
LSPGGLNPPRRRVDRESRITYQFHFTTKPPFLRFLLDPLMERVFQWETRKRLQALKVYFARRNAQRGPAATRSWGFRWWREPMIVSTPYRGRGIGRWLAETVLAAARAAGARQVTVRLVARNADAIRFFRALGFDVLGHLELFTDFGPVESQRWRPGRRLAGKDFMV